jgi:uncharacterized membrane protein
MLTRWLAILLAVVYAVSGVVGLFADIEPTRDQVIFVLLLWGGALLIVAGLFAIRSSTWPAAALVSVGAVAGALALFWSVLVPIAAIALVVLSVVLARRAGTPTAPAT